MFTYIYTLNCPKSGLVKYVGKSNNPNKRFREHKRLHYKTDSKKECWINSLKLNGLSPEMNIIDKVPVCDWEFWEKHYIKLFKSMGADLKNTLEGGEGCVVKIKNTEQQSFKKIRLFSLYGPDFPGTIALEKYRLENGIWNKGKRYSIISSDYDKIIRSIVQTGKHGGKPVLQYSLDGHFIKEWKSAYSVQLETGIRFKDISKCCNGRAKSIKGFNWIFKNGDIIKKIDAVKTYQKGKKVYQYNLNKTLVCEYNSPKEAADVNKICLKGISRSCCKKTKYNGYIWSYVKY